MKFLIQQAKVTDPLSPLEGKKQDILIESGVIKDIQPSIQASADRVISGQDLYISPGWVDIFAEFGDPGYEYKETLETGAAAAAAGGFTDVLVVPNTKPVIDNKTQVSYIKGKSASLPVNIHPIGAISRGAEGKELAEMYDMRNAGALAFSDGLNPVQSSGVLLKALQYVKTFDGILIQIPDDRSVGPNGLVHEGVVSTRLGLPGKPMMAEELLVARDIKLARYAESRLHFTGVTSPRSLEYIRRAKEAGLPITCSVTPYHLLFTDEDLMKGYDTNLKVYPHLRPEKERNILRDAVADGTIDCITSHHRPHEKDSKVLEFEYAKYGMTGLETCYSALRLAMPAVPEARWVELLSTNPRKIFGLPAASIQKDASAHVTIWDAAAHITVNDAFFRSRSRNSAYSGMTLPGKVLGVINGDHASLHSL
ncbi:dihydroorotase [Pseudobacter ginsenosidimutans]|jgi:dihydroorotase|uniref:Dihydroorotase n=1 Tax=Pseudobacter ginsenosidimutans TaxID=661488 RepID=A0A4Q7N4I9_9BACT|nr:dihydroorotase [Pseudobacter ginsenosidimutans]QEC44447.1 dihydroorotase [Pseudobacter ginsenosidimutans]RZS75919.1 dihydroorotase [Pseudobacter ginsenosidimutans]